jgi:glycosyltransferase involved in cell wall biosynthesis
MKRRKVLVSAFSCSPYEGSESGIGWNIVTRLARFHDVTVLVGDVAPHLKKKKHLDKYFSDHAAIAGLHVHYIPPSATMVLLERIHRAPGCWPVYYCAYRLWQKQALRIARSLHSAGQFDLVHELTIQSARTPGYLWQLGLPFVWGPISGAPVIPVAFYGVFGWSGSFRPVSRDILNRIQLKVGGRIASIARRAAQVFVATPEDMQHACNRWRIPAELLPAAGADPTVHGLLRQRVVGRPLRIVWSGLMVPRKALPLLLEALAELPTQAEWTLDILGDGPMRGPWEKHAKQLGLAAGRIHWHGKLPLAAAKDAMSLGDILVHTSLTEGTPNVVLEALSYGLPVICHDVCGMAVVVNASCGIKIPLVSPRTSVQSICSALSKLLAEPDLLDCLSQGALARANELTWDDLAQRIAEKYSEVLKQATTQR